MIEYQLEEILAVIDSCKLYSVDVIHLENALLGTHSNNDVFKNQLRNLWDLRVTTSYDTSRTTSTIDQLYTNLQKEKRDELVQKKREMEEELKQLESNCFSWQKEISDIKERIDQTQKVSIRVLT
eukprot:TRINITY_DN1239_c0_g1_i5.p1 TRINITY_DN1239_c0_g1~~TRINITY_DN1239_c0_g1_i5.p1  ORF type:complete len:125 (-),score=12.70 TRINITY_DN1239_c0_g1_i5:277-651(-)